MQHTPQYYVNAHEAEQSRNCKEEGRGKTVFALLLFLLFLLSIAGCKKHELPEPSEVDPTGRILSTPRSQSQILQMNDTVGAKFNLSYGLNGECLLRLNGYGHSHHPPQQPDSVTFSSTAIQQNGDYVINPNSVEMFTVATPGSSMIFSVQNYATDTVVIGFVTGGIATINQQAPASYYAVPVNGNILLIVRQVVPWLQGVLVNPTNPQ